MASKSLKTITLILLCFRDMDGPFLLPPEAWKQINKTLVIKSHTNSILLQAHLY